MGIFHGRKLAAWVILGVVAVLSLASLWLNAVIHYEECEESHARQESVNHRYSLEEMKVRCGRRAFGESSESIAILLTAFATAALVYYTLKLGEDGRKQVKIAGNQAEIAERQLELSQQVFLATHRPKIIPIACEVSHDNGDLLGGHLTVVNAGYSRATIVSVFAKTVYSIVPRPGIALPDLNYPTKTAEGGQSVTIAIIGETPTAAVYQAYDAKADQKLWCIGRINYVDDGNLNRTTGFCFLFERKGDRWVREANPDYDYAY